MNRPIRAWWSSGPRERGGLVAAMLMAASIPAVASAQRVVEIPGDETSCACELTLTPVITLGDASGPGMLLGSVRQVARNSKGVYHVLAWREHQIYRFAPDGTALPPIATEGQGPGEALSITTFMIVDDSVFAFDPRNARMTVFAPDGSVSRTARVNGWVGDAAYLPGGRVLVNTRGYEQGAMGLPLHLLDMNGHHVRSLGGRPSDERDTDVGWMRHFDVTAEGVWSVPENRYALELWTLIGSHVRTIERRTDWFEPRVAPRSWGGPDEPAKPSLLDVRADSRGYLRTIILRGGPHWAELLPPPIQRSADGSMVYPAYSGIGLFESIVEIIDPAGARLYARGVLEPELYGFVDADHVFSYDEDDVGNPTIRIWQVTLTKARSDGGWR